MARGDMGRRRIARDITSRWLAEITGYAVFTMFERRTVVIYTEAIEQHKRFIFYFEVARLSC